MKVNATVATTREITVEVDDKYELLDSPQFLGQRAFEELYAELQREIREKTQADLVVAAWTDTDAPEEGEVARLIDGLYEPAEEPDDEDDPDDFYELEDEDEFNIARPALWDY